jgi:hypothetical protein
VQQQRRQQGLRHGVSPVEHPVEAIERPVEREGEGAEEGDAQPEEMQSRLIVRPLQAHRCADEQCEQPDGRQHVIHRAAPRCDSKRHFNDLLRSEPREGIGEARARSSGVLVFDHVRFRLNRGPVDGKQQVAAFDSGTGARRPGCDLDGRDAFGVRGPENTVFNLIPSGMSDNVRDAQPGKKKHNADREDRPPPRTPTRLGRFCSRGRVQP